MPKKEKQPKNKENPNRQVVINAQYVKDLSFENPNSPEMLVGKGKQPKIDVSVDVKVNKLEENTFEVSLIINANAKTDDKDMFIVELAYAGVFTIDLPEEEKQPALMIYCPSMLFPYARRIISDSTRDGGYPPLMLDPIDFASLYQQYRANQAKAS